MGVGFWPVPVVPVGKIAGASMLWRAKGRLHVTVVVKARYRLVAGGVMTPMLPEPVRPKRGELAPYLGQADVVITAAQAHAVPPRRTNALAVRLALFREWAVINKSLLIYPLDAAGHRVETLVDKLTVQSTRAAAKRSVVVDPANPHRPGSFGPLSVDDEARAEVLDGRETPKIDDGVVNIPPMFPWSHYQVAPPDQRTSHLRGDEWVVLDGMRPEQVRLQSRLPSPQAVVRVYPPGLVSGQCYPVQMKVDQLSIDAERSLCSLLWRGSFPVADKGSAESLTVVAGVSLPSKPVVWPTLAQLRQSPLLQAQNVSGARPAVGGAGEVLPTAEVLAAATRLEGAGIAPGGTAELSKGEVDGLQVEEAPVTTRFDRGGELAVGDDGVLSVRGGRARLQGDTGGDDLIATVELVGRGSTGEAAALASPDESRELRPTGVEGVSVADDLTAVHSASGDDLPTLDEVSVDQLEITLSDALEAQGLDNVDALRWREAGER